jgi:hypothetical protein
MIYRSEFRENDLKRKETKFLQAKNAIRIQGGEIP